MPKKPKPKIKTDAELIAEYRERGGKVTRHAIGEVTPNLAFGNFTKSKRGRKKKTDVVTEVIVP